MNSPEWINCIAGMVVSLSLAAPAEALDVTLSSGLDYSTGKYGGGETTEIYYIPVTAKFESGASTVKLTLPYLRITASTGGNLVGVDAEGRPVYDGVGSKSSQEGVGDVVVSYSYSLIEQPLHGFLLDLTAKAKLATAATGLGSGKNDYTALLDVFYLAGAWTPFTTISYRITGEPDGSDLRNVWGGTLGLGYKHSSGDSLGFMWDLRQSTTTTGVASNDVTAYWVHKFAAGMKLQTYAVKGMSEGSADWGLGLVFSKSFN